MHEKLLKRDGKKIILWKDLKGMRKGLGLSDSYSY